MASIAFPRPVLLLIVTVGFAATLVAWAKVADTLVTVKPVQPATRPTAIIWDNFVFPNRASLARWLRSRGASYDEWARNHPASAAILERRPPPVTTATVATATTTAPTSTAAPTTTPAPSPSPPAAAPSRVPVVRDAIFGALLVIALALGAAALLPPPVRRRYPELSRSLAPYRDALVAGASAITLGVAIGVYLG